LAIHKNAKCIKLDDQCTTKDENLNCKTKFSSITISQKNSSAQLQRHITKTINITKRVELHFQKRFCPCAIVLCLNPQHTPTPIHNKQNIPIANKSKNKNHSVATSSNNATTNFKL
jgi:hypothetical protein